MIENVKKSIQTKNAMRNKLSQHAKKVKTSKPKTKKSSASMLSWKGLKSFFK